MGRYEQNIPKPSRAKGMQCQLGQHKNKNLNSYPYSLMWYINLDLATLEKSVDLIFGFVMASGPYMANLGSPSYIFPCTAHFFSNNAPSEIGHLLSSRQFIRPGKTNIWMRYEQILQMDL